MPHYSGPEHHRQSSVCGQTRLSSMFSSTSTWYIVIILPCINIAQRSDKPSNSPTRASLLFLNYQLKITSKDRMPTAVTCWQGRRRSQEFQILSLLFQFCCDFYYLAGYHADNGWDNEFHAIITCSFKVTSDVSLHWLCLVWKLRFGNNLFPAMAGPVIITFLRSVK